MDTSLKKFNENQEKVSERKRRRKIAEMGNPAWAVTWRVLLICAAIDLPLWAYFHFVKGVSLWEGLQQVRYEVQANINPPKTINATPHKSTEQIEIETRRKKHIEEINSIVASKNEKEDKKKPTALYSWKNEDGYRGYSNTGFPENGKYTDPRIDWR